MNRRNVCDKCGQPVEGNDNAVMLEAIVSENGKPRSPEHLPSLMPLAYQVRHLRPSATCEGSPSRWSRIIRREAEWVKAYTQLLGETHTPIVLPEPDYYRIPMFERLQVYYAELPANYWATIDAATSATHLESWYAKQQLQELIVAGLVESDVQDARMYRWRRKSPMNPEVQRVLDLFFRANSSAMDGALLAYATEPESRAERTRQAKRIRVEAKEHLRDFRHALIEMVNALDFDHESRDGEALRHAIMNYTEPR